MTKLIPLQSIEHGIRRAVALLGDAGVETAMYDYLGISRSSSLIRKCADPDDDRHHLQMRYGVALDRACRVLADRAPILESFVHLTNLSGPDSPDREVEAGHGLFVELAVLQVALGDLARRLTEATAQDSESRGTISAKERHRIFHAIDMLEHHAQLFKSFVTAPVGVSPKSA